MSHRKKDDVLFLDISAPGRIRSNLKDMQVLFRDCISLSDSRSGRVTPFGPLDTAQYQMQRPYTSGANSACLSYLSFFLSFIFLKLFIVRMCRSPVVLSISN